ncbi:MAG: HAD family hydrolase [Candidatus Rokubacteria bacterium]|nr:HAD family hydrolase [Candidatus Rokubacteria bacterium]
MPGYTTVLFDMFDTLVRFDRDRLPLARINGREVHSSVARLYPVAAAALPGVTIEAFYEALLGSYQEAERRREVDHREIPAFERFGFCYARLGVDPVTVPRELTERLIAVHMACLAGAAEPLPGRRELLDWLAGRYRLGLVSNFDYSPTVERILEQGGIRDRFAAVVVSDAVGWRKPSASIFQAAFARLGVDPRECLFVGDRPEIDVAGAKGVGMDVAWLNAEGAPYPSGLPRPDFTLARLADLRLILEGRER